MTATEYSDSELVSRTLAGERDAFGRIVSRYQTLICSLAYSRLGHLGRSEDVAQETFIIAWKDLRLLREPDKLRAWLCGIVRNRVHKSLEREGREPVHDAEPLEAADNSPAHEALPSEQTIGREEEAILWRSLEKIPELYREPLILYYREHQSIEHVAVALDLTEDAVKQRLSRGRKLLQDEVQTFVEGALRRTAPGQAFSGAVLAMLPLAAGTATTAGMGVGAKGTAAAKSGFLAAWFLPLMPFLGFAAGIGAQWLIICSMTTDRKARLKQLALVIATCVVYLGLAVLGDSTMYSLGQHFDWSARFRFVTTLGFWWCYITATITLLLMMFRRIAATRQAREAAGEIPSPAKLPMRPGALALAVAGGHLMMFSWLIRLAWNANDRMAAGIATGMMLVLGLWSFFQMRGKTGEAVGQVFGRYLAFDGLVILAVLNLRADVWVASAYGVSVAEAHSRQPVWIVPLLSFALLIWVGILSAVMKPKLPVQ